MMIRKYNLPALGFTVKQRATQDEGKEIELPEMTVCEGVTARFLGWFGFNHKIGEPA